MGHFAGYFKKKGQKPIFSIKINQIIILQIPIYKHVEARQPTVHQQPPHPPWKPPHLLQKSNKKIITNPTTTSQIKPNLSPTAEGKQISKQTHKNQPLDTQICHCQIEHPLPPNHDQNFVRPPLIDVDRCMRERDIELGEKREWVSRERREKRENKKIILLLVLSNISRWL